MPFNGDWINLTTSGLNWSTAANWHNGNIPNSISATANFNMALPGMSSSFGTRNINLDGADWTLGTLYLSGDAAGSRFWDLTNGTLVMRSFGNAFIGEYTNTAPGSLVHNEIDANMRLESNTDFYIDGTSMLRVDGNITEANGIHSIQKLGTGTLHLTGNNAYTAGTTVTAGTLFASGANALGTGNVINNGTLGFAGFVDYTVGNSISGTGDVVIKGGGLILDVTLSGTNTYTGSTDVQLGTLKLGADGAIGTSRQLNIEVAGTFDYNGFNPGAFHLTDRRRRDYQHRRHGPGIVIQQCRRQDFGPVDPGQPRACEVGHQHADTHVCGNPYGPHHGEQRNHRT